MPDCRVLHKIANILKNGTNDPKESVHSFANLWSFVYTFTFKKRKHFIVLKFLFLVIIKHIYIHKKFISLVFAASKHITNVWHGSSRLCSGVASSAAHCVKLTISVFIDFKRIKCTHV